MRLGTLIAYFFEVCCLALAIASGSVFYFKVSTFDHNEWLLILLMVLAGVTFLLSGFLHFAMGPMPQTAKSMKQNKTKSRFFLILSFLIGTGAIVVQVAGISTFVHGSWLLWGLLIMWGISFMRSAVASGRSEPWPPALPTERSEND